MGLLSSLFGSHRPASESADVVDTGDSMTEPFACSSCGRTDLAPAGDWNPPICEECDAAINFDAIEEFEQLDEADG